MIDLHTRCRCPPATRPSTRLRINLSQGLQSCQHLRLEHLHRQLRKKRTLQCLLPSTQTPTVRTSPLLLRKAAIYNCKLLLIRVQQVHQMAKPPVRRALVSRYVHVACLVLDTRWLAANGSNEDLPGEDSQTGGKLKISLCCLFALSDNVHSLA